MPAQLANVIPSPVTETETLHLSVQGSPVKKENEDYSNEGKGIAARILGPSKPVRFHNAIVRKYKRPWSGCRKWGVGCCVGPQHSEA